MTDDEIISLPYLRALIGLRVDYLGKHWRVVEVLEMPPGLVLEMHGRNRAMQTDLHGRPWEYMPETLVIPLLTENMTGLSDELLALDLVEG